MRNIYQTVLSICFFLFSFLSLAQVPVLSSYPSASATIFLDFDGDLVNGTSWNWNGPLNCNQSNLNTAQMVEIFNRISEDYRPFNIDVTTDSTKYLAAPINKRSRIIFTITSAWYGSAGGVSYIGSFTWGDNTPAFVFTALLGYNTKYIAEAASHEAGHTLGLRHQSAYDTSCNKTAEYNSGTGTGEIAWAPIMGVGYYRNFTLWNNGANPYGCTSYQDDLGIITSAANGFSYRSDDHSNNSNGGATATNFVNSQFNINGVIERISDKDNFKFTMPVNGIFHLNAIPYNIGTGNVGSNLDVQVTLLSGPNNVIGTYNPLSTLDLSIDTFLNAGNYFIRVEGKGNAYAPEYASLGSYNLNGSYAPIVLLPVRKLELRGTKEKGNHKLDWAIEADEKIIQQSLEVSGSGTNFHTISLLNANATSFNYAPRDNGLLKYRLNVKFESGHQYYSNIVALSSNAENCRPYLKTNLFSNIITVMSPSVFAYTVIDYSGRTVAKGALSQGINTIQTSSLSNGMYIIQFNNGQEQFVEKFIKQ